MLKRKHDRGTHRAQPCSIIQVSQPCKALQGPLLSIQLMVTVMSFKWHDLAYSLGIELELDLLVSIQKKV